VLLSLFPPVGYKLRHPRVLLSLFPPVGYEPLHPRVLLSLFPPVGYQTEVRQKSMKVQELKAMDLGVGWNISILS